MKIIAAGATGFIGNALVAQLRGDGHDITLLTRHPFTGSGLLKNLPKRELWDGKTMGPWARAVDGVDAVINLAGEPIAQKRWTPVQKETIANSRVDATRAIVAAIRAAPKRPVVLINASAVGYYGQVESGEVLESHEPGHDFLAATCAQWETEARMAETLGVRVAIIRIGIVLEKGGGALGKILPPFQWFVGGPLGSGRQWFPWVHRDDVIGAIRFALANPRVAGPCNVTAPEAVTMQRFCETLGKVLGRPSWAPVPAFVLKIMLGEMAQMLLGGQKAVPKKLNEAGYSFRYPLLEPALAAILKK